MKLTRHNGRSGKHGTYNPRHNDRRFDVENSEHIDADRARQNIYWDCYRGFTTHEFRENPEQPDLSFEEIERMFYYGEPLLRCPEVENLGPGKVDACVNLYWVLPDADFRRICGFAALPGPVTSSQEGGKLFETDTT